MSEHDTPQDEPQPQLEQTDEPSPVDEQPPHDEPSPQDPDDGKGDQPEPPEWTIIDASDGPTELVNALAAAMADAGRVVKDRTNTDQGWKFASVESMLEAVRLPLFKRGVILTLSQPRYSTEVIHSRSGTPGEKVTVAFDFTFRSARESFTISGWEGDGVDYADKAKGKAITNAIKTFIRAQWLLPTELDDDPDRNTPEQRAAREPAAAELPAWARSATPEQRKELGDAVTKLIGPERARALAQGVKQSFGGTPGCIVGFTKALVAHFEAHQQDGDAEQPDSPGPSDVAVDVKDGDLSGALAEAAERKRQADASAEPDVPVDTAGLDEPPEPDPAALDEQARLAALPPAGSVSLDAPVEALAEQVDAISEDMAPEQVREALAALCICPGGLDTPADQRNDQCPIKGHGIPF